MRTARRALQGGLALLASLAGCAAPAPSVAADRDALAFAVARLESGRLEEPLAVLNSVLEHTQGVPRRALQRFHAACLLTELHVRAAAGEPFLEEATSSPRSPGGRRSGRTAHLVSALYHAGHAQGLEAGLAGAPTSVDGRGLLPDELAGTDLDETEVRLTLHVTLAWARLGFRQRASELLGRMPGLLRLESCLAFLDAHSVAPELFPWVCEMVHAHLATGDEREAYRFAIAAIEGRERFGHGLPADETARLEAWILDGAAVRFVCPESQTDYLPGRRRSPVSGVPHMEYVPVPREAGG